MIPPVTNGTAHNRAVLEDLLNLLNELGYILDLPYGVIVEVDTLVADIEALFQEPKRRPVSWWNRMIYVGRR